ncbi:MAG TPA: RnfABCDGE type electron transport complex subunit D [Acidisphaera sp.]|nr:RnfABCDGE type electron transport complex subunit D [Acidisphaera sp.]
MSQTIVSPSPRSLARPASGIAAPGIDARWLQIGTLAGLLALLLLRGDPGVETLQAPVCIGAALLAQAACCRLFKVPFDWRSPAISGLSLSLLLRADALWLWALAGALAIGSKFTLRVRGKHVFNPANFAIAALLLAAPDAVWVSPGQWGDTLWLGALLVFAAIAVLGRAARADTALAFVACYGGLLLIRCLLLGDPLAIPAHQMRSGALLLFAFFMITDPRATPDSRAGRLVFAACVAALAYWLQFRWQIRPGLFLALFAVSPLTPLLDRRLPARRFVWSGS